MMMIVLPLLAQTAEYGKHFVYFLWSQNGGGLVEYQYSGAAIQRLQYFDSLLLSNRKIGDVSIRINLQAVLVGDLTHPSPCLAIINSQAGGWLRSKNDVFSYGERFPQA